YPDRDLPGNELIICYQQQPIGLAKKVGNRIKNNYPRDLVRDGKLFSL
ncbi:MAG TPA: 16S rRNA (cytosine(1407)-C(5))-methyltransferase RsmF, partial [Erwinia persicina]|nr:16S rRNA (cytosine(1407)-C(5))-methyltransferase RsmF [Erwinia persicina]